MTKKSALLAGLVMTLLFFSQFLFDSNTCGKNGICNRVGDFLNQDNLSYIIIAPFFLLLSLITYKMKEETFRSWWNFARWFVPIIMVVTFLLEHAGSGGGYLNAGQDFTFFILFILYSILIITSLTKIVLAYRRIQ